MPTSATPESELSKFAAAIAACMNNANELREDARSLLEMGRPARATALAVLSQEEYAKAFILVLVRDGHLPWTSTLRRLLHSHECKHLIGVVIEWLYPDLETVLSRAMTAGNPDYSPSIPHDVAVAMNLLRYEKFETFLGRERWTDPEWNGPARKISRGYRDRQKQDAVYVRLDSTGRVSKEPMWSSRDATAEMELADRYAELARDAANGTVLSFDEYGWFTTVVTMMFGNR